MNIVLLREAQVSDAELILAWRSIPEVYHGLYTQRKENRVLTWAEHWKWWKTRYTWKVFIIQVNDGETTRSVGYVNLGQLDHWKPEVGLVIGETTLWGQGIAKQALLLAIEWLKGKGYKRVHTSILKDNEGSMKLFQSVGFNIVGEARDGEWEVELRIA